MKIMYFHFCNKVFLMFSNNFLVFHYVLFNVPFIFCYFLLYGGIALGPISCIAQMFVVKMLAAKMFTANMSLTKTPDKSTLPPELLLFLIFSLLIFNNISKSLDNLLATLKC